MIDLNWTEIFFLAVLATVMFGPEKLPEYARKAARVIAYVRDIGNDARSQLRAELGPEFDDIRLSDLNPRNFVTRHLLTEDDKNDLLSIRDELRGVSDTVSSVSVPPVSSLTAAGSAAQEAVAATVLNFDPEAT